MISRLHYITQETAIQSHDQSAELACQSGADWVQLRIKNKPFEECCEIAFKTKNICEKYGTKLIINDYVELAKTIKSDGVHLGKLDMSPKEARNILGDSYIIGGTANTFEDIQQLAAEGVDYIGLGPFRFTTTKANLSPILGLIGYQKIIRQCHESGIKIPIIAIGGLNTDDVKELIENGLYGVAVSSAITHSEDKEGTIRRFFDALN